MKFQHPCFDKEAHCRYGRVHLPVAPLCNIKCVYCKREYDCPNESRPGVCSRVETAEEAFERLSVLYSRYPENKVVGIAGPGEPLANEETFRVFEMIRKSRMDMALCLSTNGLYLPESLDLLRELEVKYITVTMNAVTASCAEKIYSFVSDHGKNLYGRDAVELLLERQQEGIRKAVEQKFCVKVNMVLMDGINVSEALLLAEKLSQWNVYAMNMNSVINVTGDPNIKQVSLQELRKLRAQAAADIHQIDYCRQCRADAFGIPGIKRV